VARLVGINHVALEVGDLEEALEWYRRIFEFQVVREANFPHMAFLQMGDQFLNLTEGRSQPPDTHRHFGLVVDDKPAAREALEAAGAEILPGRGLDFLDPWGNHIQVVEYGDIQFSKTPEAMRGMGLELPKSEQALAELRESGLT
jgi:lactoylglutathione lyase